MGGAVWPGSVECHRCCSYAHGTKWRCMQVFRSRPKFIIKESDHPECEITSDGAYALLGLPPALPVLGSKAMGQRGAAHATNVGVVGGTELTTRKLRSRRTAAQRSVTSQLAIYCIAPAHAGLKGYADADEHEARKAAGAEFDSGVRDVMTLEEVKVGKQPPQQAIIPAAARARRIAGLPLACMHSVTMRGCM